MLNKKNTYKKLNQPVANSKLAFWQTKSLYEMTQTEWESLCDGCGKCCLEKIEDEDSGKVYTTKISCRLLNLETCKCNEYKNRFQYMNDCIKLTPRKVYSISWLPKTCAYRLVKEKKPLPLWHPLITKNPNSTLHAKQSAKEFAVHPKLMKHHLSTYILEENV